ncbi:MAG: TnsA endonuclease N-terminal domain-containing protein [bacterium]
MSYNSSYKKWHKPNKSEKAKTYQGYYKDLKNPNKYIGDPKQIIYRSSWEFSFIKWCDFSPSVLRWSSEPVKVPYYDRVSNLEENRRYGLDPNNPKNWKVRHYYTDFWVEISKQNNEIERWFVEIKPACKLKRPKSPPENAKVQTIKKYNREMKEYLINEAKFYAINEWAKRHNSKFYVFTENTLGKVIGRFWHS